MSSHMPALTSIQSTFRAERPLDGWGVLLHMHMTQETVALGGCLSAGGGEIWYLPANKIPAPAIVVKCARAQRGRVLDGLDQLDILASNCGRPILVVEGSGRIFSLVHEPARRSMLANRIVGISEHTSGGGKKVDAWNPRAFRVPVVAVYRDPLKCKLETGLGTSQSTVAALLGGFRAPVAGRRTLIVGFGNVGSGLARALTALGARILVTDIAAERRLTAQLAGFPVVEIEEGLACAEICITSTGSPSVLNARNLAGCRDRLRVANVSDAATEIDVSECQQIKRYDDFRSLWRTPNGRSFLLLGDSIQVNHVVGSGNPARLMDLSFSLHALVLRWLAHTQLSPGVLSVPRDIRDAVVSLVLGGVK